MYVEEYKQNGKLVVQGKKVGRMFTLDVNVHEINAVMFAQGTGVVATLKYGTSKLGMQMFKG